MPNPRKPKRLKEIEGTINVTRDRKLQNSLEFPTLEVLPDCPQDLAELKRGEKIWADSVRDLYNLNMLHTADLQLLMAYCVEMCRYWECQDQIKKAGTTVYPTKDKDGNVLQLVPLPYIRMASQHLKNAQSIGTKFGFTPSDRAGIEMPTGAGIADDPMERLLQKYN